MHQIGHKAGLPVMAMLAACGGMNGCGMFNRWSLPLAAQEKMK